MNPETDLHTVNTLNTPTRRVALQRLGALAAASAASACGGGGDGPPGTAVPAAAPAPGPVAVPPALPPPPPPPSPAPPAPPAPPAAAATPLSRLKSALARPALTRAAVPVDVSQTRDGTAGAPSLGANALILPTPRGFDLNPNPASLADIPQVWGHRRELWTRQRAGFVGTAAQNQSWFVPVSRDHRAASLGSQGICGLHFRFDGRAFELLVAGTDAQVTLVADGQLMAPSTITTTLVNGVAGSPLNVFNAYLKFDFRSRSARGWREASLYCRSSQGPCALAFEAGDRVEPWDRSAEASMACLADSYGGAPGPDWGISGPFWEAAAQLGIAHLDLDALGGTGYAPQNTNTDTRNPGNAFVARLAGSVNGQPDLFITAGGINDNNSAAALPLFASAEQARSSFDSAVAGYYRELRAALPQAVLVALGPWAPRESAPTEPVTLSKANTIRAALQAAGGLWVFVDNLRGGWFNSAGASGGFAGGPWQTGTGRLGATTGIGNGDRFVSADGTHPTAAGCLHLGTRLAVDLRAAILAL